MTDVVLLLGLVERTARAPGDAPAHRRVQAAPDLDALVLDRPAGGAASEEEALALAVVQAGVLSAYAAGGDVLPVALGAAFSDDCSISAHLCAIAPRISADRAALAGGVEYMVAVEVADPSPPSAAPDGAGYLRRRQADRDARLRAAEDRRAFLTRVIDALVESGARCAEPRASRTALMTVSALLRRGEEDEAAARLAALAPGAARLGLRLRMIGPCAPFSFVAKEPADA